MASKLKNGEWRYPYIADKNLYAAVRYAGKLVREHGTYNWACNAAAKYYNVDASDVRRELSMRAGAGHRKG